MLTCRCDFVSLWSRSGLPEGHLPGPGVPLSVSTDVHTTVSTTLSGEYERLRHSLGWLDEDFRRCTRPR
jgi:hypothetical protein